MGMRMLLDDMLSIEDVQVVSVETDAEALRQLKNAEVPFQAVVCQAPPVGAKHSLVAKIRAAGEPINKIPVICLSPHRSLQHRATAFESGASEYVELPVNLPNLAQIVHTWATIKKEHRPYD